MDIEDALNITTVASTAKSIKAVASATAIGAAVSSASGAGIMSTLATAGAALGGGVVAGVGAVAGGAGAGVATLLNQTVFEDSTEAKVGSYAGAAVGTVGSLSALQLPGLGQRDWPPLAASLEVVWPQVPLGYLHYPQFVLQELAVSFTGSPSKSPNIPTTPSKGNGGG
jgi:hypothetical protein